MGVALPNCCSDRLHSLQGPRGPGAPAEEEEEEEAEWAQEQIRKGMGGLLRGEAAGGGAAAGPAPQEADLGPPPGHPAWGTAAAAALAAPAGGQINAAAEEVMRALQQGLQRLQVGGASLAHMVRWWSVVFWLRGASVPPLVLRCCRFCCCNASVLLSGPPPCRRRTSKRNATWPAPPATSK